MVSDQWGRSQHGRHAAKLDPAVVRIDERSPEHFLRYMHGYAQMLNFHDQSGVRGDWRPMLDSDVSFLLAEICNHDRRLLFEVNRLVRRAKWNQDQDVELKLLKELYKGMHLIDGWHRRAIRIDGMSVCALAAQLTCALAEMIKKALLPVLAEVSKQPKWWECWRAMADAESDNQSWDQRGVWLKLPASETSAPEPNANNMLALELKIDLSYKAGMALQQLVREYLERSLTSKADHPAHTTLLIAFVQLLGWLKTDLNRFTERHLDFHYRTVLQLEERSGKADAVYVMLQLAAAFQSWTLPAGSLLPAGKDAAGAPILYVTERELTATQVSLSTPRNLYMKAEQLHGQRWITRVLAAVAADKQDGVAAQLQRPELGWPMFSRLDQPQFASPLQLDADLGLYVTSPLLALASGRRHVRIGFVFDGANFEQLHNMLRRMQSQPESNTILSMLADGFCLHAGTAGGWQPVPNFCFSTRKLDGGKMALNLHFTLKPDYPALAPNPKLPGAPAGAWPCLRLRLNPLAKLYQFSTFSQARIERCQIAVIVRGLTGMVVTSELGPLAADKPFQPFGAQALYGAQFEIAHPELATTGVRRVRIRLAWLDQLNGCTSLADYYANYGLQFGAEQFTLALARYDGARWVRQAPQSLFSAAASDGALPLVTRIRLQAPAGGWPTPAESVAQTGAPAQCGTLRLELASPAYGFGSALYPTLAANLALKNARLMMQMTKEKSALPQRENAILPALRPPLAPLVRTLECDYYAAEEVTLVGHRENGGPQADSVTRLYYLYPFGNCPIEGDNDTCLLGDDDCLGRLYLGLQGAKPGESLVLHFQFRARTTDTDYLWQRGDSADAEPLLRWRYLSSDRWRDFAPGAVESSTRNFSHSGLVTLQLPADISDDNRTMPCGQHWIEVRANDAALSTIVVGVLPHAVRATRYSAPSTDGSAPTLAPNRIESLQKKTPAIRAVLQPYPSVGGSASETVREFRARVSERLRHKQRASQPADYEQLVLAGFPGVRQAKCITSNNSRAFRPPLEGALRTLPGEVTLAVVQDGPMTAPPEPLPRHVLQEIANYLSKYASESVQRIRIRNPRQEVLQVFVNVDFELGAATDVRIKQLDWDISNWLAPWCNDPREPLLMGCHMVHCNQLAQFISDRPYVKKLSKVALLQTCSDGPDYHAHRYDEGGAARLSTPWSVFVPAVRHAIGVGSIACPPPQPGIGSLAVRGTLVVGAVSHGDWPSDPNARQAPPELASTAPDSYVIEVVR